MKQDKLARLLHQMVPPVDETGVWESIEEKAGSRRGAEGGPKPRGAENRTSHSDAAGRTSQPPGEDRPAPRTPQTEAGGRRRLVRVLPYAAAAIVALVALGFGINALVDYMTRDEAVVIITDEPMQPATAGGAGTPAVAAVHAAGLPSGVSAVVGRSETSIWHLSLSEGLRSLNVAAGAATTGEHGDRVAYVPRDEARVFLWQTDRQGEEAVTEVRVGGPFDYVDVSMSPDETKLLVSGFEFTDPSLDSGIRHDYLVNLETGETTEWHWDPDDQLPYSEVTKIVWSPSSEALYVSFGFAGGSQGEVSRRYQLTDGSWDGLEGIAAVRDANNRGDVVGLGQGPAVMHEGFGAADAGSLPMMVWSQGSTQVLPHADAFALWDQAWIAEDGAGVVVLGMTTTHDGSTSGVSATALEILRRGDGDWTTNQVFTAATGQISDGLGFQGDGRFYFASRLAARNGDLTPSPGLGGDIYLGSLDPVVGREFLAEEALPVPEGSRILRVIADNNAGTTSDPAYSSDGPVGSTTTATGDRPTTIPIELMISISGAASFERPEGTVLFEKGWGSEPDQIGHGVWEQAMPSQEPILAAVSPDESTIAVGDYANHRVQLFARDGTFLQAIPYSGTGALVDIAYDTDGRLFALVGNDVLELPTAPGGEVVTNMTHPWDTFPSELELDESPIGYQLIHPDSEPAWLLITDPTTQSERRVQFTSEGLPLNEYQILGYDSSGNCCVMIRIYEEHWEGTESWYYLLVSPQGECLGQVRLPLDFWAGGSCTITPSGTILELRSVEAGIILTEYELRTGNEPGAEYDGGSEASLESAGRSPEACVLAYVGAINRRDPQLVYSLYASCPLEYDQWLAEWLEADEVIEDLAVHGTTFLSDTRLNETVALVRVTYTTFITPPGGQRYSVVVAEPGADWATVKVKGLWKVRWLPRQ